MLMEPMLLALLLQSHYIVETNIWFVARKFSQPTTSIAMASKSTTSIDLAFIQPIDHPLSCTLPTTQPFFSLRLCIRDNNNSPTFHTHTQMSGDTTTNNNNQFTSAKYQGHTAPVLSLAVSEDYSLLLSGSEDHTARLWDLRDNNRRRASLCIQTGGEVLSVAFTPKNNGVLEDMPAVQLSSPFAKDHSM